MKHFNRTMQMFSGCKKDEHSVVDSALELALPQMLYGALGGEDHGSLRLEVRHTGFVDEEADYREDEFHLIAAKLVTSRGIELLEPSLGEELIETYHDVLLSLARQTEVAMRGRR